MLHPTKYVLKFSSDVEPYMPSVRDTDGYLPSAKVLEIIIRKLTKVYNRGDVWIDRYNADYARRKDRPQNKMFYWRPVDAPGYVYVLKSGDLYKIGKAKDVHARFGGHRTSNPAVSLVAYARCADYDNFETDLHRLYASRRVQGEWFRLTPTDLRVLKRRLYQERVDPEAHIKAQSKL